MSWGETILRLAGQAFVGGVLVIIAASSISGINAWGAEHIINSAMNAGVITAAFAAFVFISSLIWSAK